MSLRSRFGIATYSLSGSAKKKKNQQQLYGNQGIGAGGIELKY